MMLESVVEALVGLKDSCGRIFEGDRYPQAFVKDYLSFVAFVSRDPPFSIVADRIPYI